MKAGLVGYAQSGKTTLFDALTGQHKHGTAGRGVNLGAIKVPDARIDALSAIFKPKLTTYAEMQFVDVPGPARRAPASMPIRCSALAEVDAFCLVVRGFPGRDGAPADPERELRDFDAELVLHDLGIIEKRLDRLASEHKQGAAEHHELERLHAHLDRGVAAPHDAAGATRRRRSSRTSPSSRAGRCSSS